MPPFKSEAQRRKFGQLLKEGKITKRQFDEFAQGSPEELPERVGQRKRRKR